MRVIPFILLVLNISSFPGVRVTAAARHDGRLAHRAPGWGRPWACALFLRPWEQEERPGSLRGAPGDERRRSRLLSRLLAAAALTRRPFACWECSASASAGGLRPSRSISRAVFYQCTQALAISSKSARVRIGRRGAGESSRMHSVLYSPMIVSPARYPGHPRPCRGQAHRRAGGSPVGVGHEGPVEAVAMGELWTAAPSPSPAARIRLCGCGTSPRGSSSAGRSHATGW